MKQSNMSRSIVIAVAIIVIAGIAYLYGFGSGAHDIAANPNICSAPDVAKGIMARVSEIQKNNGSALIVTDMEDVTTVSRSANGDSMDCHATFVMSNGTRTAASFSSKRNIAGQPVMQFTPDVPGAFGEGTNPVSP